MVAKLVAVVNEQHGTCCDQKTVVSGVDASVAEGADFLSANRMLQQKKRRLETENELLQAKILKSEKAARAETERKRQESRAGKRRLVVNIDNITELSVADKSTAMTTPSTGLIDCVKYWARGSAVAVLQLVLALISHFKLEDQVAAELRSVRTVAETNQYIVGRLSDSLQILKQCQNEEQRREYRIVLTALAPDKVAARQQGMGRQTAEALGVNRKAAPFLESIDKRAEIDAAAKTMADPLKVGDDVVCRHGFGTLLEIGGSQDPVEIELKIGERTHAAKFDRPGKGAGGARLHRVPILFAHKPRSRRKDTLSPDVKHKVPPLASLIHMIVPRLL